MKGNFELFNLWGNNSMFDIVRNESVNTNKQVEINNTV